jgi:hypothetical protein
MVGMLERLLDLHNIRHKKLIIPCRKQGAPDPLLPHARKFFADGPHHKGAEYQYFIFEEWMAHL